MQTFDSDSLDLAQVDAFVERWSKAQAAERSNGQPFLVELCQLLGVEIPGVATADVKQDAYVFERPIRFVDGTTESIGRADLYKRGAFVLETKQGIDEQLAKGGKRRKGHGVRGSSAWEGAMAAAKNQAARYARNLEDHEPPPPLVIVADVGYCFDLYASFGRAQRYVPFPDAQRFRIHLPELRDAATRERLRMALSDPDALDPSRHQAAVTRGVAATLAGLAAELESGHAPDAVFGFLSRCLFTMFAEDAGLIPSRAFSDLLTSNRFGLDVLPDAMEDLWRTMDTGGFSGVLGARLRRFNGSLFKDHSALRITQQARELLARAASADWRQVEPAIFGTLLERALDPRERHKLGAHYTPRAYVERLVMPAVIDPLREEWEATQVAVAQIEEQADAQSYPSEKARAAGEKRAREAALVELRRYLSRLTSVRILDPACGSGNFLYVTLEHLKRLEGEVARALARYGEASLEVEGAAVTPAQLLGIEVNPRAAAIADLVLWIGYLQWHLRTHDGAQGLSDPVLRAFGNIACRDAVLAFEGRRGRVSASGDAVTVWDGRTTKASSATGQQVPDASATTPVYDYDGARQAEWPEADFIVGNPPFVGNKRMRDALGDGYVEALRRAYPDVPESADLVMYWWHKAARAVRSGHAQRFGLITTNSLTMVYNRRIVEQHLNAEDGLALIFAIPDHPWVDGADGAAVRVAMTIGGLASSFPPEAGVLALVTNEHSSTDEVGSEVITQTMTGIIHSDLTVGADVTSAEPLDANSGLSFMGLIPLGTGFRLEENDVARLDLDLSALPPVVRPYKTGGDVARNKPDRLLIDFFGFTEDEVRERYPALYHHLLTEVKPFRDNQKRTAYRENWWLHGEARPQLRGALEGLDRFIATVETSKHRYFVFVDAAVLPDQKLRVIASDDAYHLGVLSSRIHVVWAAAAGGTLEDRPVYNGSKIFDPFPFPGATADQVSAIQAAAEALDAHRASRMSAKPSLTPTLMYNALEKLRAGEPLSGKDKRAHDDGLVSTLVALHDRLDALVAAAYGWPAGLDDQQILERLVALNAARREEEAAGRVRYLRPSFQAPDAPQQATLTITPAAAAERAAAPEPWPDTAAERAQSVMRVLRESADPVDVESVAARFKRARRSDVAQLLDISVALGQARRVDELYAS